MDRELGVGSGQREEGGTCVERPEFGLRGPRGLSRLGAAEGVRQTREAGRPEPLPVYAQDGGQESEGGLSALAQASWRGLARGCHGCRAQRWDEAPRYPGSWLGDGRWGTDVGGAGSSSGHGWMNQTASPHCLAQGPGCRCWRPLVCWRSLPTGWSSPSRPSSSPGSSTSTATARAGRAPALQPSKRRGHTAPGGGAAQTAQRPLGKLAQPQLSKGARGRPQCCQYCLCPALQTRAGARSADRDPSGGFRSQDQLCPEQALNPCPPKADPPWPAQHKSPT